MSFCKSIGDCGEDAAVKFLKKKHYKVIQRNYKSKYGEIDIIAKYKKELIFIEVKTRNSKIYGGGAGAVNFHKRRNIILTSQYFMESIKFDGQRRYDIIEVYVDDNDNILEINHIENGFPWEGRKHGFW